MTEPTLTYFCWQDTDKKKAPATKIEEAIARCKQVYSKDPTVVLVNALWAGVRVNGVEVRVEDYIRPDNCWVGRE